VTATDRARGKSPLEAHVSGFGIITLPAMGGLDLPPLRAWHFHVSIAFIPETESLNCCIYLFKNPVRTGIVDIKTRLQCSRDCAAGDAFCKYNLELQRAGRPAPSRAFGNGTASFVGRTYVNSDVRIEFMNDAGNWEVLNETKLQLVCLHKERIMSGLSRAGSAAGYRVVDAESGKVLDRWYAIAG